ncbi:MAG: glycoside hydrolase family 3 N-terminal domain-containing protein [Symbiopectobacterium sp.]
MCQRPCREKYRAIFCVNNCTIYQDVTITDALAMGAIADHFTQQDALDAVFKAGVDIALMPVSITSSKQDAALSTTCYNAFRIASTLSLASPNSIWVFSLKNSGFCTPA